MGFGFLRPKRRYFKKWEPRTEMTRTGRQLRQVLLDIEVPDVPDNLQIERLFAGCNQRAAGAYLWVAHDGSNTQSLWETGSSERATDIVKAHKDPEQFVSMDVHFGVYELFAERKRK